MSNFYGQYIGFGSGTSGAGAAWYGTRGISMGGYYPNKDVIDYVTIQSTGNAIDFGDISSGTHRAVGGYSNATRGVAFGGRNGGSYTNQMDYITIASTGDSQDFGNLTTGAYFPAGTHNGTYGIRVGGSSGGGYASSEVLDYVTIASVADAQDFGDISTNGGTSLCCVNDATYSLISAFGSGLYPYLDPTIQKFNTGSLGDSIDWADLNAGRYGCAGVNSLAGRGIWAGGSNEHDHNFDHMDYVTIQTQADAQDFGNMVVAGKINHGMHDETRGVITQGYNTNGIQYITMASLGDSQDFGDLTVARGYAAGFSGS